MRLVTDKPPIPTRATSALREVERSRRYLDSARCSLEVAVEIYVRGDAGVGGVPIAALERVLGQLEEAEAALWEAAP